MALGFNLIYKVSRFFNLSYGVFVIVGGYSVYYLHKVLEMNLILSIVLGLLFTGVAGWATYRMIFQKFSKNGASNMVMLVASLGLFMIIQSIVAMIFSSKFQNLNSSVGGQKVYNLMGAAISEVQIISVLASIVATIAVFILIKYSSFGKVFKAISDNEDMAKIVGIKTEKFIGYTFFLGSFLAGIAGVIIGFDTGMEPSQGISFLLKGVIAAIIGGVGNIYGSLLGAYTIGFLENFGIWEINGVWKDTLTFVFLLIYLFIKPFKFNRK